MTIETIDISSAASRPRRADAGLWGGTGLLVRRRMWRDRALLLASVVIVALATLLSFAGPRVVLDTIDDGASDAVEVAGDRANILVEFPVGNVAGDNVNSVRGTDPADFTDLAADIPRNLPGVVAPFATGYEATVTSNLVPIGNVLPPVASDASSDAPETYDAIEFPALFNPQLGAFIEFGVNDDVAWTVVEGRMPVEPERAGAAGEVTTTLDGETVIRYTTPHEVVELALTQEVSDVLELPVGSAFVVRTVTGNELTCEIVGIVAPADGADPIWERYPHALDPIYADNPAQPLYREGTVIVSTAQAAAISDFLAQPMNGTVEVLIGSDGMTLKGARDVAAAMKALNLSPDTLLPTSDVNVSVSSGLKDALEQYPQRARAALAQMSVMVAGVIGVAAVVIALMARLLLSRRSGDIALERARGASVPSIALRLLIESIIFTSAGLAAGYYGAVAIVGELSPVSTPAFFVAVVAVVASPALGVQLARRTWTGRRTAANRTDRAKVAKARRARRATLEALALVVAGLAVVTLQGRGVLQTQTSGIDPFLAAAPLLLAVGTTVIVLRLFPFPLAIIQMLARRTRGAAGVIALAKARQPIPVLPLLALTLAIAIATAGGMLVATVQNGQEQASWERVGGDVRVDGPVDEATVAALRDDGFTVSRLVTREATSLRVGNSYEEHFFIGVDEFYPDVLDATGVFDSTGYRELLAADAARAPGAPLPALGSPVLRERDFEDNRSAYVGRVYVELEFIGDATVVPDGWAEGPYVIVPLAGLQETDFEIDVPITVTFVLGDGAEAAVLAAGVDESTVASRNQWLSGVRDSALIGGVERMMTLAVLAVAVLAAVGLLVTVLQGVKERGLSLSMLRTQGLSNRYGWWLALSELAPLVAAAVLGGGAGGFAILLLLGRTLGLEILAGGIAPPPLVADPIFLGAVGAGIAIILLIAVSLEVSAHRRNKLSEVLRLGEAR